VKTPPDDRTIASWANLISLASSSMEAAMKSLRQGRPDLALNHAKDAHGRLRTIRDALTPYLPERR
jgi:hypothetical protein